MSTRPQHIREFVETMYGPIVFIGYFGLIYLISSVLCALAADPTPPLAVSATTAAWVIGALTVTALLALAFLGSTAARRLADPGPERDEEDVFLTYVTLCLTLLSVVGVIWTAATSVALPLCS